MSHSARSPGDADPKRFASPQSSAAELPSGARRGVRQRPPLRLRARGSAHGRCPPTAGRMRKSVLCPAVLPRKRTAVSLNGTHAHCCAQKSPRANWAKNACAMRPRACAVLLAEAPEGLGRAAAPSRDPEPQHCEERAAEGMSPPLAATVGPNLSECDGVLGAVVLQPRAGTCSLPEALPVSHIAPRCMLGSVVFLHYTSWRP